MRREATIKRKSTKTPVLIYRLCLKICFSSLILLCGLTLEKGFAVTDRLYSLSLSCAVIFSLLYQIIYYYYKMHSGDIKYNIMKEPIKYQIIFMLRILVFLSGVALVIFGACTAKQYTNGLRFVGVPLIMLGLVFSQLIYNNKNIYSHFSTFFINATIGIVIYSMYYAYTHGLTPLFFGFIGIALLFLVISEISFYFYNGAKHKHDKISKTAQQKIRIMYFLRNAIALIILYLVIILLIITESLQVFEKSNIFEFIFKIIPVLISLTTVTVLLYNNFLKPTKITQIYAPIKEEKSFIAYLKENYPASGNLINSLNFVVENMNAKKGFTRYSGEDYYFHPLNVAKILLDKGIADEDTLSAALLHDCIEDIADCDSAKIASLTNEKVAVIVEMLSKKEGMNYKQEHIMRQYLDNILTNGKAVVVKVADRMHNMSELNNISEEKRTAKWTETKLYYLPLLETASKKYSEYSSLFEAAKQFFEEGA